MPLQSIPLRGMSHLFNAPGARRDSEPPDEDQRASHRRAAIGPESSEFSCSHRRFARYIDENVLRCWSATTPRGARGVPDPGKLAEDGFVRAAQAEQHDVPRESSEGSENRQRSKSGESSESSKSSKSGKSSKSSKSSKSRKGRKGSDIGDTGETRCDQPSSARLGAAGRGAARHSASRAAARLVRNRQDRAAKRRLMARNLRQGWRVRRQSLPRWVHEPDAILIPVDCARERCPTTEVDWIREVSPSRGPPHITFWRP